MDTLVDGFPRSEDPGADGADRAIHDCCDVFIAEAFHLTEGDGGAQVFREVADCLVDDRLQLFRQQVVLRGIHLFQGIITTVKLRLIDLDVAGRRAPVSGNQVVFRGVDGDAIHPGVKRAVSPEIGKGPICLDECILGYVMNLGVITDKAADDRQDFVLILDYEQVKGALIAFLNAFNQLLIRILRQLRCLSAKSPKLSGPTEVRFRLSPAAMNCYDRAAYP